MSKPNTMSHVGLEDDYATPEQLKEMVPSWHVGFRWSGPETGACGCSLQSCGLLVTSSECTEQHGKKTGAPKQLHRAAACPG